MYPEYNKIYSIQIENLVEFFSPLDQVFIVCIHSKEVARGLSVKRISMRELTLSVWKSSVKIRSTHFPTFEDFIKAKTLRLGHHDVAPI